MNFVKYEEKNILYNDWKHIKLSLGNMDTGLQVKEKLLNTETDLWRGAPRISRIRKVRNVVIRQKSGYFKEFWKNWKMCSNIMQV